MKTVFMLFFVLMQVSTAFSQTEIFPIPGPFSLEYYTKEGKISKNEVSILMQQNPTAYSHWKTSSNYEFSTYMLIGVEVLSVIWLGANDKNGKSIGLPLAAVVGSAIGSLTTAILSGHYRKKALMTYNGLSNKPMKVSFMNNDTGIGLAISLNR